jgi:hypothetical protein
MLNKPFLLYLLLGSICSAFAPLLSSQTVVKSKQFHYFEYKGKGKGLIIFLHGSVNYFLSKSIEDVEPEDLLENNSDFLKVFKDYDIVLPLVNSNFNWLDSAHSKNIVKEFIAINPTVQAVLAGFSDGGTGAFKLMHASPGTFSSVWMFGAFPQHRWFTRNLDRSQLKGTEMHFIGSYTDKTCPYEFSLLEYLKQKQHNEYTYFHLVSGSHRFSTYDSSLFFKLEWHLQYKVQTSFESQKNTFIRLLPFPGECKNDTVLRLYYFRKRILRKYGLPMELNTTWLNKSDARRMNADIRQNALTLKTEITYSDKNASPVFTFIFYDKNGLETLRRTFKSSVLSSY